MTARGGKNGFHIGGIINRAPTSPKIAIAAAVASGPGSG